MNGALLLLPFLLIRFGLMALFGRGALRRAGRFAPLQGNETVAYFVYQGANAAIFITLPFLTVRAAIAWPFFAGCACYLAGLCLCAASVVSFALADGAGMSARGVYRFSRNPMYVSYFLCFMGMALLTRSWVLAGWTLAFQGAAHWIILSEERWCLETFGAAYARYMRGVRRYL